MPSPPTFYSRGPERPTYKFQISLSNKIAIGSVSEVIHLSCIVNNVIFFIFSLCLQLQKMTTSSMDFLVLYILFNLSLI